MRIHRIHLRNVRGVTDRSLELPESGVVVIEGPNEIGKSTFLEAFDRLLDPKAKSSSKAAAIVGLQPVGLDVGPHVEAELTIGGHRLVFAKRWLRQPMTTLHVLTPVPEQWSGEAAQQRMDAILESALDRPLLEALRFAQSGTSGPIRLGESAVLAEALDGAAGADLHSTGGEDLLQAVETEYRRYYTAHTGKPAGDLRAAIAAAHESQDAVVEADRNVSEAALLLDKRDHTSAMLRTATDAVPALEETLHAVQRLAERASGLRERERASAQRLTAAGHMAQSATEAVRARQGLVDDAAERSAAARLVLGEASAATLREQELCAGLAAATDVAKHARDTCSNAQNEADRAAVAVRQLQGRAEVATLVQRLGTAEKAAASLDVHRRKLGEAVLTPAVWRDLDHLRQQLAVAEAALKAGSTSVSVSAIKGSQHVEHNGQAQTLGPDGPDVQVLAGVEAEVIINGSVRVLITPHADVVQLAGHRDLLVGQLRQTLDEVGAADVDQAAEMHEFHCRAQDDVARSEHDRAVALAGNTLTGLRGQLAQRRASLTEASPDAPASSDGDTDSDIVEITSDQVDQAASVAAALQSTLQPLRIAKDAADDELRRVRDLHAASERSSSVAQSQYAAACAEAKRATDRLDGERLTTPDAEVASNADVAIEAKESAAAEHQTIKAALLASHAAEVDEQLQVATADVRAARGDQERLAHLLQNLNGQVEVTAGEGRQEAYERAVQGFEGAKRTLSSVDRRARAARQLHVTLQRHRERAHSRYVAPYADQIVRLGRSLYGDSFGVVISPDLVMTHRHLHGATVAFEHLSGGAKEQLGIVARLAVAMLVEGDQSVPVVIDDALGYTDPERLKLLGALLGGSDHPGQIIVLTCTPARYRSIPGAGTVRMTA